MGFSYEQELYVDIAEAIVEILKLRSTIAGDNVRYGRRATIENPFAIVVPDVDIMPLCVVSWDRVTFSDQDTRGARTRHTREVAFQIDGYVAHGYDEAQALGLETDEYVSVRLDLLSSQIVSAIEYYALFRPLTSTEVPAVARIRGDAELWVDSIIRSDFPTDTATIVGAISVNITARYSQDRRHEDIVDLETIFQEISASEDSKKFYIAAPFQDDPDMASPLVTWASNSSVTVNLPDSALGNSLNYKLQDMSLYPFSGPQTCDLSVSGVGGLDDGSEAVSTWYHLYLVLDGVVLKPILSVNAPDTGPVGFSEFVPIFAIYNDASGNIRRFQNVGRDCYWTDLSDTVLSIYNLVAGTPAEGAWSALTVDDAIPADVAESVYLNGVLDGDSGLNAFAIAPGDPPIWTPAVGALVPGQSLYLASEDSDQNSTARWIPLSDGTLSIYWIDRNNAVDVNIDVLAWTHKYRS